MSPLKKESAYFHLPTYTAGILYHLGTFLSTALFIIFLFNFRMPGSLVWVVGPFLGITGVSGLGILVKRLAKAELRHLSSPDDYISNMLVTGLHLLTAAFLWFPVVIPFYFIWAGLLFLYIPIGKLRHLLYFFAARYHLGFFFGWRDAWPPKKADQHGTTG
jgi:hypothetical protein